MTTEEMKAKILDKLRDDWVTYVELQRVCGDDARGDLAHFSTQDNNIVFWTNCSDAFLDAIDQLMDEEKMFMHPAERLTYMIDGVTITMPMAKRPPAGGYKKPHWLPICFRSVPLEAK